MTPIRWSGVAGALAATLIWGTQFPVAKSALQVLDAVQLQAARTSVGALLLFTLLLWREGRADALRELRTSRPWIMGWLGIFASPTLVYSGLMFTRPEVASIIVATQPAMTALGQWWMRGRRPSRFTLLCVAVAFVGVLIVVTRLSPQLAPSGSELIGDAMVLAGAACWVAFVLRAESVAQQWSALKMSGLTTITGAIGVLTLALLLLTFGVIDPVPAAAWRGELPKIGFLSVFGMAVAMLCWNAGTARLGPLNAMLFSNLIPVVTFGVRWLLGHPIAPIEWFGAALVIAALVANNLWHRLRSRRATLVGKGAASR